MSNNSQLESVHRFRINPLPIAALVAIFVVGIFTIGFDQGHLFSIIQGADAFDESLLHEFSHDVRHAAGFPCH